MTSTDIMTFDVVSEDVRKEMRQAGIKYVETILTVSQTPDERLAFEKQYYGERYELAMQYLDQAKAFIRDRVTPEVHVGWPDGFWETGTEGVIWMIYVPQPGDGPDKRSYDGLKSIEDGDHLRIEAPDGSVLFDERILFDWKTGYRQFPMNPSSGQQCALGYWIHGVQTGWEPDAWAGLFMRKDVESLKATLTKYPPKVDD